MQQVQEASGSDTTSAVAEVDAFASIERQAAGLTNLVLQLSALADRYEAGPRRADQQARVDTLRSAVERARRTLVALACG